VVVLVVAMVVVVIVVVVMVVVVLVVVYENRHMQDHSRALGGPRVPLPHHMRNCKHAPLSPLSFLIKLSPAARRACP
jgi:hypothetical protein